MRENDQNNSEYGHFLLRISTYSVRLGENADLNSCEYGHFLRSEWNFLTFWDSINWACNFKLSLNALSCFPDLADKRKKIGNCFRNTSYQKRLSKVVKSIERWVMDALKWKKLQSFSLRWNGWDKKWNLCYFKKANFWHEKQPLLQL